MMIGEKKMIGRTAAFLAVPLIAVLASAAAPAAADTFRAHLSGRDVVPPVETRARGQVTFNVSGINVIDFKLMVANIENIRSAHIHCGGPLVNGTVVVVLAKFQRNITMTGMVAEGTITQEEVRRAKCDGAEVGGLSHLINLMSSGNAYVKVSTLAHLAGEIRGQIR